MINNSVLFRTIQMCVHLPASRIKHILWLIDKRGDEGSLSWLKVPKFSLVPVWAQIVLGWSLSEVVQCIFNYQAQPYWTAAQEAEMSKFSTFDNVNRPSGPQSFQPFLIFQCYQQMHRSIMGHFSNTFNTSSCVSLKTYLPSQFSTVALHVFLISSSPSLQYIWQKRLEKHSLREAIKKFKKSVKRRKLEKKKYPQVNL